MRKFELTITPSYVPSWGIVEAVRELFQNALDQEKQHEDNTMSWSYDADAQRLSISNKSSVLEASSLLLGQTSKADDESTIGQFGEGYKIATLVLLRNNKHVTFYNYGKKEIWRPRFVNSRRFGTQILTFFVETLKIWDKAPDNNLTIVIDGITEDEFKQHIVPANLHMQTNYKVVDETSIGQVLDIPGINGQVFVNGLFVCNFEPYQYSYNFNPGTIQLDRDRKMVSDFDLRWQASKMWSFSDKTDLITALLVAGKADVAYLKNVSTFSDRQYKLREEAFNKFVSMYGSRAVPVCNQLEAAEVPKGWTPIIVPESFQGMIKASTKWASVEMDLAQDMANNKTDKANQLIDKLQELIGDLTEELKDYLVSTGTYKILGEMKDVTDALRDELEVIENELE